MNKEEKIKKTLKTTIVTLTVLSLFNFIGIANTSYSLFNTTVNSKNSIQLKTSKMEYNFDYTGGEQTFTVPYDGKYQLETWGAQGGEIDELYHGGFGGYSLGMMTLSKKEKLYINVGGAGVSSEKLGISTLGGYNGGGSGIGNPSTDTNQTARGGGGATHISTITGLLSSLKNNISSILIVSGSGGGAGECLPDHNCFNATLSATGGSGGGYKGASGDSSYASFSLTNGNIYGGFGGSQTEGGITKWGNNNPSQITGKFGQGGNASDTSDGYMYNGNGGGAGFFGGGAATRGHNGGGGGSGYIGNTSLTDKHMACYNCETSNEESTKTISVTCASETPTPDCAKIGNGYARITYIGN